MTIHTEASLSWTKASPLEQKMLRSLQGNILKGHGRHFTTNIFLSFGDVTKGKRLLRELANHYITDAYSQLQAATEFKLNKASGGDFCHVALSAQGYTALGMPNTLKDQNFINGMKHRPGDIGDDLNVWEEPFKQIIHAVILGAADTNAQCSLLSFRLLALIKDADARVIHVQGGKQLISGGEGIEHFGYVDGRSQPLMLREDIDEEVTKTGSSRWDPEFPLSSTLIKDPGVTDKKQSEHSFGSYFVFRKLEQNVRGFKLREQSIAKELGLKGDDRELAGAMIVGRFEDGTPVTLSDMARGGKPGNDFNYVNDEGSRCPFHAHIRKVNPRGSGGTGGEANERQHIMVRRGITYEDLPRETHPDELPEAHDLDEFEAKVAPLLPTDGVGLLFMAYNRNIEEQFKFSQVAWANNDGFPLGKPNQPAHGIDPVIGQPGASPGHQRLPKAWDDPSKGENDTQEITFGGFVKMLGGEYFFSPSLTFLKNL